MMVAGIERVGPRAEPPGILYGEESSASPAGFETDFLG
jgi:hypothetical protein